MSPLLDRLERHLLGEHAYMRSMKTTTDTLLPMPRPLLRLWNSTMFYRKFKL